MTKRLRSALYLTLVLALALVCRVCIAADGMDSDPTEWHRAKYYCKPAWEYRYEPIYEGLTNSENVPEDFDWHWGRFGATLPRTPIYSSIGR